MLVLRRKVGEGIVVDGTILVSVLAVEGNRIKVGITAPPDITIMREELLIVSHTHAVTPLAATEPSAPAVLSLEPQNTVSRRSPRRRWQERRP